MKNISEFEAQWKDYNTNEAFRAELKGCTDLCVSGSREIMQVAYVGRASACRVLIVPKFTEIKRRQA